MAAEVLLSWSWMVTAFVILATAGFALKLQNQVKAGSPKGHVSLPFIGDTVQFLRHGARDFLQDCLARYGDPFTISIMGEKNTVVNSPEAIKFVLSTADLAFKPSYSSQFKQLTGEGKLMEFPGHPHYRRGVLAAVTGDGLLHLLPFISSLAEKTVMSWENRAAVITHEEMRKVDDVIYIVRLNFLQYTFTVTMHILWREVEANSEEMEEILKDVRIVMTGVAALPINFPGFAFHKALKAGRALMSRILEEISKRREAGSEVNDYLNTLLKISREIEISDHDIFCVTMSLMFAAHATSATLNTWVVKYLHDYPEVRQRVQDEQDRVRQKMVEDESLMWFKPKSSMPYTLQVINEVLRIESLASFLPRKATKDVDYKGIVFREGSNVWASLSSTQLNPKYHPNPLKFNPSRFEEEPKRNTFRPFGQGRHLCPGSDLAITETLFMIHHLVTKYSWERFGSPAHESEKPIRMPLRIPAGGFPIVVKRRVTSHGE